MNLIRSIKTIIFLLFLTNTLYCRISNDSIVFNFEMAENTISFINYARFEPDLKKVKERFYQSIATTDGYRCLIKHLSRFNQWDDEKYFDYLINVTGIVNGNVQNVNDKNDIAKKIWKKAFIQTDSLKKIIEKLKEYELNSKALILARKYLPLESNINISFFFIIHGSTPAFSLGKSNAIDLLHIPKKKDGEPDIERLITIIAHEIHHSGFFDYIQKNNPGCLTDNRFTLLGTMVAEGMPTYYINQMPDKLNELKNSDSVFDLEVAKDWEKYGSNLITLFKKAEIDIKRNLDNSLIQDEIFNDWMKGAQGAAYVLGANMFYIIDKYLGLEYAIEVLKDFKKLLAVYNQAVYLAQNDSKTFFLFDNELITLIQNTK
ncbi:MAG: DUF5700 domain-containing putative Zn-dependent protease [Melioribacteraceae bacterium]|nr:DUF5700 domain-containing putative Zn-dependent protease [Melioribacteraceae bacterium]